MRSDTFVTSLHTYHKITNIAIKITLLQYVTSVLHVSMYAFLLIKFEYSFNVEIKFIVHQVKVHEVCWLHKTSWLFMGQSVSCFLNVLLQQGVHFVEF